MQSLNAPSRSSENRPDRDPSMVERHRIVIRGDVQGVGFRWAARALAERLHLYGTARNISDGSVEVVAEGTADALREFEAWCYSGPTGARVTAVEVTLEPARGVFRDFVIV